MKRRQALQAILGTPVLASVPLPAAPLPQASPEIPKLTTSTLDGAAEAVTRYFSPPQMAALQKLGDLMMPESEHRVGAKQAEAPEFLDFLISQSPADRQKLYRDGLDRLQASAKQKYGHAFEELTPPQADAILAPLREPWTYNAPADPFARFLRAAREDLLAATVNSREFAAAQEAAGRRGTGMNTYWYTIE